MTKSDMGELILPNNPNYDIVSNKFIYTAKTVESWTEVIH